MEKKWLFIGLILLGTRIRMAIKMMAIERNGLGEIGLFMP